ncbi:murein biosynthesis integral membrane protein MurJ [Candidatus Gottesmanbacteria bacterium]|nr:murein biosynthesis integral membrane protein MurJ [Candidatus Gottesmanbacteria bacterium]
MVKNFFKNSVNFLNTKQTDIVSAATVIMFTVAVSKILGVIKLRMLSARFTPDELGVYFASFRLPNLLFEFLVLGALTSAFIPVFTRFLSQDKKDEAFHVASSVINISIVLTLIFSLPIFVFSKEISLFLTPGFNSIQLETMASFTRIILIAQVIPLIIGNFLTGILQSFKRFLIPALAPIVYDIGIIVCIYFLSPKIGLYSAVYGVVVGSMLFFLIQIPMVISLGYRFGFNFDFYHKGVREIGKLMLPRSIGLAASQIDATVDLILASLLGARSITIFNFAQTLQLLPILLFGSTISQAALPTLSEEISEGNPERFKTTLLTSLHQILFLVFPASILLLVLRVPVVRLAFGAKLFDWEATILTGKTLAAFAISVFAQSGVQILARAFYAMHDSKTPVMVGIFSVVLNIALSVVFIYFLKYPVWALGISTSIASIVNVLVLLFFLDRKVQGFDRQLLLSSPLKILFASLITGAGLYIPMKLLDQLVFDTTRTINLIILTGVVSIIGFSVYLFLAVILKISEARLFLSGIAKIGNFRKILITSPEIIDAEKPNP